MSNQISFFLKESTLCPVCENEFHIEVLRSGGGRLNTSKLGLDLRRHYIPSKQYGMIYPLIYSIIVCPNCWFASLKEHFHSEIYNYEKIKHFKEQRMEHAVILNKNHPLDFTKKRNLHSGLISYFLALHCYSFTNQKLLRNFCKGLCSLRASWCAHDLASEDHEDDFSAIEVHFRYLSNIFYQETLDEVEKSVNNLNLPSYGPDVDYDFGFKGAVLISCLLGNEFIELIQDDDEKLKRLDQLRIRLSKVFGVGKVSKKSPSPLLEKVRLVYEDIKNNIEKIQGTPLEEVDQSLL